MWLREDGTPYYVGKGKDRRAFRPGCPPRDRIIIQEWFCEIDALAAEIFLIAFYGRKDLGTGCLRNLTDGGESATSGWKPSERTKHSIAEARQKQCKSLSIEARVLMTAAAHAANIARPVSTTTRQRMRDSHLGKKYKSTSIEARQRISAAGHRPWTEKERESHEGQTRSLAQRMRVSQTMKAIFQARRTACLG